MKDKIMYAYNYHPITGEYLSKEPADACPLEEGVFLVADYATLKEPPSAGSYEVAVYSELIGWSIKIDWRNTQLYKTSNGTPCFVEKIGLTPHDINATTSPMPSQMHVWKDGWVYDEDKEKSLFINHQKKYLFDIEKYYTNALQGLLDNPTQLERSTWSLKKEIAESAPNEISAAGQEFLRELGVTDDKAFTLWCIKVKNKQEEFGKFCGIVERQRILLKKTVREANNINELKVTFSMCISNCQDEVREIISDRT